MNKYIGNVLEIIYIDSKGKVSQRRIDVRSIRNDILIAFCHQRRAQRAFRISNILAHKRVLPVSREKLHENIC